MVAVAVAVAGPGAGVVVGKESSAAGGERCSSCCGGGMGIGIDSFGSDGTNPYTSGSRTMFFFSESAGPLSVPVPVRVAQGAVTTEAGDLSFE